MNHLKGIHHVTAITSSAEKNYEFFTYVLRMRLVKKNGDVTPQVFQFYLL